MSIGAFQRRLEVGAPDWIGRMNVPLRRRQQPFVRHVLDALCNRHGGVIATKIMVEGNFLNLAPELIYGLGGCFNPYPAIGRGAEVIDPQLHFGFATTSGWNGSPISFHE